MRAPEIYEAAVFGDVELVKKILSHDPAAVNARDEYGFTPLHGVAGEDQLEMGEYLIQCGANVQAVNDSGVTPLHLAAYPDMVKMLVRHGADIEAREGGGGTPLHLQSENPGGLEVLRELLKLGANVNAKDNAGETALDTAFAREESDKVDLLLSFGALHNRA
jgi:ankyrin repeat protein